MPSIGELLYLPFLRTLVQYRTRREEKQVKKRYYHCPIFRRCEEALEHAYALDDPFALSKEFLEKKGVQEIYAYGETPLTTLEQIGRRAGLRSSDHLVDLGCGRGRGLLFLCSRFGCTGEGIDWLPTFIERAQKIAFPRVSFHCDDLFEADLQKASHIYLYGSCFTEEEIERLVEKLQNLKSGTTIVTVSYPLSDYCEANLFRLKDHFIGSFPWGRAEIFIQEKI